MSSWSHYIIEADNSEKALSKAKSIFNLEKAINIEVINSNRFYIEEGQLRGEQLNISPEIEERWQRLSDEPIRVIEVSGSDTSDVVSATLYEVKNDSIEKIKHEYSRYWYLRNSGEHSCPYQGHSYLPAYFYRNHNFKMFDKTSSKTDIDYEKTYNPSKSSEEKEYNCPYCGSKEVEVKGWNGKCKNCEFERSEPWFRHREFRDLARQSDYNPPKGTELTKDNPFVNSEVFENNEK